MCSIRVIMTIMAILVLLAVCCHGKNKQQNNRGNTSDDQGKSKGTVKDCKPMDKFAKKCVEPNGHCVVESGDKRCVNDYVYDKLTGVI